MVVVVVSVCVDCVKVTKFDMHRYCRGLGFKPLSVNALPALYAR